MLLPEAESLEQHLGHFRDVRGLRQKLGDQGADEVIVFYLDLFTETEVEVRYSVLFLGQATVDDILGRCGAVPLASAVMSRPKWVIVTLGADGHTHNKIDFPQPAVTIVRI